MLSLMVSLNCQHYGHDFFLNLFNFMVTFTPPKVSANCFKFEFLFDIIYRQHIFIFVFDHFKKISHTTPFMFFSISFNFDIHTMDIYDRRNSQRISNKLFSFFSNMMSPSQDHKTRFFSFFFTSFAVIFFFKYHLFYCQ